MATRRTDGSESSSGQELKALIAANLTQARTEARLSQTELGRLTDLDAQQISKWERAVYRPSDEALLKLASKLGRDYAWFVTDHDEKPVAA